MDAEKIQAALDKTEAELKQITSNLNQAKFAVNQLTASAIRAEGKIQALRELIDPDEGG